MTLYRPFYRSILLLLTSVCYSIAAQAVPFVYDGQFVADEYDRIFSVSYEFDGRTIENGILALATVGTIQYMYMSHPLGFKDLSYGCQTIVDQNCLESSEIYRVGWDGQKDGNTGLGKTVDSEYFEFSLTTGAHSPSTADDVAYSLKFDIKEPISDSKINGTKVDAGETITVGTGDAQTAVSFISTLDYNASQISGGNFDGSLAVFGKSGDDHSPETLSPRDIAGCADETSSDPSCYQLANTTENTFDGNLVDWVFDFGLEIELSRMDDNLFFGDLNSLDLSNFGYKTGNAVIRLDGLHASDPKTLASGKHAQTDCANGTSPDHEPCFAEVVTASVPEPSILILLGLGLLGLGLSRTNFKLSLLRI